MYTNTETGEYPIRERDIRKAHPNVSFPRVFVPPSPYEFVHRTPKPATTYLQRAQEVAPVFDTEKQVWQQQWTVVDMYSDYTDENDVLVTKAEQEAAAFDHRLEQRRKELAALRYEKETAGIDVNGTLVATDEISQLKLTGAIAAVGRRPNLSFKWKTKGNGFVDLTATQIGDIADAVTDYVQACFANEAVLYDALAVDIDTDITVGWPDTNIS